MDWLFDRTCSDSLGHFPLSHANNRLFGLPDSPVRPKTAQTKMPTTIIKSVSKSQGTLKPLTGRIGVLAERFPNRVAIATKDSEVTYSQLWKNSEAFAKAMLEDIESPGRSPRVVLMLNDACDQACAYIGLMRAGVTAVLVEAMFRGPPLNKLSHIEGVPYDYEGADRETRIGRNLNEGHVSEVVNITGAVDVVKPQRFTALLERGRTLDTIPLPTERDPGVVLLTAGTTGTPKLVEHSAEGVFAAFEMLRTGFSDFIRGGPRALRMAGHLAWSRPRGIWRAATGRKVWLTSLSANGVAGHSLLMQALLGGETFVGAHGIRATELLDLMWSRQANVVAISPIMGEMMERVVQKKARSLPYLLVIGLGADKPRKDLAERLESRFKCQVSIGYGSTELGGGITATNVYRRRPDEDGAVGVPFPGVRLRVVSSSRQPLPSGSIGEIECVVPNLRRGDLIGSATPAAAVIEAQEGECEWVPTGDRGWLDPQGQLFVVGRSDDVIVKGGYKIDPTEVETALESHDEIIEAAAISFQSQRGVVRITAYCVLSHDSTATAAEIRTFCEGLLPDYAVPNRINKVDELPRTPQGKLKRSELRRRAIDPSPDLL